MANMPTDFWSGWVIVLTSVSFVGLGWLVLSVYFMPAGQDHGEDEPVWDSTLEEGSASAPMWWFWMILAAMVFSVIYLMLYPGMGSFSGAFNWSQGGQLDEHGALFSLEFEEVREELEALSLEELAQHEMAMEAASRIFMDNCAACHGPQGEGQASLFPDLRDADWQWGGSPEQIEQTIRNGRLAAMVSWQAILGDEGVQNVADYVSKLSDGPVEGHAGQIQYNQFCIACHGPTGDGNALLGAPRLNDDVWLYGGTAEIIKETISQGRSGQMPAFNDRLNDLQIQILIAWLLYAP